MRKRPRYPVEPSSADGATRVLKMTAGTLGQTVGGVDPAP